VPTADVLMMVGFHVPVTPSTDVPGNIGAVEFMQIEFGRIGKVGTRLLTTVIFTETGVAH
jgi:hypothetical protein